MTTRSMTAGEGGRHQQADGQGQQDGQVPALPQLPEQVGQDHADGAVGEVEDAGGVVGDHQAGGTDGVDRPSDDAGDQQTEELAHGRLTLDGFRRSRDLVEPTGRADEPGLR